MIFWYSQTYVLSPPKFLYLRYRFETWIKKRLFIHGLQLFPLDIIQHKNCGLAVQVCNEPRIFWNYGWIAVDKIQRAAKCCNRISNPQK